ncbi:uncharacterized protein LOC135080816 [Ostrinia nubilalis]|uniref:uncharacterized protein LOC135080816 n=1 Tax=Ostrinia nubilalis TaxID=29057 RepID=UPI0030824719
MPFGLKNAPSTFQRLMNTALSGLNGIQCFVYLDDIVIYSPDLNSHVNNLASVFHKLRKFNLKLQPDKCEFLRKEVTYLGHVITNEGVKPNPDKIKAVTEFPIPESPKDVKSFLGLVSYYRRFIPEFSKIAKPLTSLLKKDEPFIWENPQQLAFDELKQKLTTAPILSYPDFSQPFNLTCDASNHAISAILSQGPIGKDQPVAYASRTLNKAECNYSVTEKECLAIVWGTKVFRPYLYGHRFKILTDHKPLKWLFNCKDPGSKLVRWRLKLEEFDYEIEYKKGRVNSNADALSRYPVNPVQHSTEPQNFHNDDPPASSSNRDPPLNDPAPSQDPLLDINLDDFGLLEISPHSDDLNVDFDVLEIPSPQPDTLPVETPGPAARPPPSANTGSPVSSPSHATAPETENININEHNVQNSNYSQFLKAIGDKNKSFDTNILEHNESLTKSNCSIILIPTSLDLDDSNPYVQEILSKVDDPNSYVAAEKEIFRYQKIPCNNKIYYFIFTKVHYFDEATYPDIFRTLENVKTELLSEAHVSQFAISDFKNAFEKHSFVKIYNMLTYLFNNTSVSVNIYHNNIIYPTPSEISKIMKENHDIPIAGHLGTERMLNRIRERYYWKNMKSDIEHYVKNCSACQSNKALRQINRAPMQITTTSTRPFERVSLDIVGPLPEAGLNKLRYILTLQDDLTKFSIAYPISNATAEETCECLVHFISLFGIPKSILTDQGTNFTEELFKKTTVSISLTIVASDIVQQIDENPGIYFDPIGTVRITSDDLHVLVPSQHFHDAASLNLQFGGAVQTGHPSSKDL